MLENIEVVRGFVNSVDKSVYDKCRELIPRSYPKRELRHENIGEIRLGLARRIVLRRKFHVLGVKKSDTSLSSGHSGFGVVFPGDESCGLR